VPVADDYGREERRVRLALRAAAALGVAVLALSLLLRLRPAVAGPLPVTSEGSAALAGRESGTLGGAVSGGPGGPAPSGLGDTAQPGAGVSPPANPARAPASAVESLLVLPAVLPESAANLTGMRGVPVASTPLAPLRPDTGAAARRRVPTDLILLPCWLPNPRSDGSFIIPPHDPAHRTIVALPSRPGEPRRGLVIPPHDTRQQTRVPVRTVPLDSLLDYTIRIPPHDPERFITVERDTLGCLGGAPGPAVR